MKDEAKNVQPVKRGFGKLICPMCGEEATISISLDHLEQEDGCKCDECNNVFSTLLVRALIRQWTPVLAWLETAPEL